MKNDEHKPKPKVEHVEDRAFNDQRYFIFSGLLHKLGWKPEITLENGLRITLNWYKENSHKFWFWETTLDNALEAHPHFDY